jgi:hypothetical protein
MQYEPTYDIAVQGGTAGKVDPRKLMEQLDGLRNALSPMLDEEQDQEQGRFRLSSLEIGLTVSAEGNIVFVSASVTASITLTFSRPADESDHLTSARRLVR